jgi:hypothetical protein
MSAIYPSFILLDMMVSIVQAVEPELANLAL